MMFIEKAVGIDVGLDHYNIDSDCNEVQNPRHLKHELKKLRREQKRFNQMKKGSRNREKQRIVVAHIHERIQNQRSDFHHKLSKKYVDEYDLIVTEKLRPLYMIKNRKLARSIQDASWSSFNQKLAYKAERAGKLYLQVDAKHTSQICPVCGRIAAKTLSQRTHVCPCGYNDTRDHASSLVILKRGLEKGRSERPELKLVDSRPLLHQEMKQVDWMKQKALLRAG